MDALLAGGVGRAWIARRPRLRSVLDIALRLMYAIVYISENAMKRPAIARDLVPVNEFRANMAAWMQQLGETGRPVVLTQRGRAAAVLVDPAVLDEMEDARVVVKRVLAALDEVERGDLHEDADVWDEIEEVIAGSKGDAGANSLD